MGRSVAAPPPRDPPHCGEACLWEEGRRAHTETADAESLPRQPGSGLGAASPSPSPPLTCPFIRQILSECLPRRVPSAVPDSGDAEQLTALASWNVPSSRERQTINVVSEQVTWCVRGWSALRGGGDGGR